MIAFYQSKTFWLNFLMVLILVAALVAPGAPFVDLVTPIVAKWLAFVAAILNIVLRVFFTESPIANPLR